MINEKQNGGGRILQLLILFVCMECVLLSTVCQTGYSIANRQVKPTRLKVLFWISNNEPIIGASVYIPGTNTGVATDLDGNFTLKVPANTKRSNSPILDLKRRSSSSILKI